MIFLTPEIGKSSNISVDNGWLLVITVCGCTVLVGVPVGVETGATLVTSLEVWPILGKEKPITG
jgi:hypothetical protein